MTSRKEKIWQVGTLTYTTAGLCALFLWMLSGDFTWQMKERSIVSVVQLMLKKFDASDALTGFLMGSLPQALGLLFGPIIAYRSDRHRGRWGRRIPFLLGSTPIVVLAILGLAYSPVMGGFLHQILGSQSPGLNADILILLGLFWMFFDVATIIANCVFSALINDVVPQQVIGRFFGFFRALSLLAGVIFNHWIIGHAEAHYVWIFLGLAVLYGGGFTLVILKVKEGDYPPPPPQAPSRGVVGFLQAAKGFCQEVFGIPYYWWFYFYIALSWMTYLPISLFGIFFAKSIHMDIATWGNCLALTFSISFVLAYPLGALADRVHPLPLGLFLQALFAAVTLWGGLYATDAWTFGIALVAQGVVSGMWMTATASIAQRLLPRAQFAQFGAGAGIVSCFGGVITGPSVGFFLDHTNHVYRYTYLIGSGLEVLAIACGFVLYRKFVALGGPKNYIAPE